ncbi:MAG: BatA domain-containing protein, partial [Bacteroidales bacterium]|nr:BatA domain-containing protein [Bacteroidales bacterium]
MDSFRFAHPEALYLLLLVPLVLLLMWLFRRNRANSLNTFGDRRLIAHLMPDFSPRRSKLKA